MNKYELKKELSWQNGVVYRTYKNGLYQMTFFIKDYKSEEEAKAEAIKFVEFHKNEDAGLNIIETIKL